MDFKARNPNISYWQRSLLETICSPFPYDEPVKISLFEIDAPDFSTQFLGLPEYPNETEELFITYLIEAPEDCPMRRKFEFGEITWQEFWHHRAWLIEYRYEFAINGGAHVRYVHPSEMDKQTKLFLAAFNNESPMLMKLKTLERRCAFDWNLGDDREELAVRLAEFREKYPGIAAQADAMSKAA